MFEFKMDGLDEAIGRLKQLGNAAKKLDGEHSIPLGELLSEDFMRNHSAFIDMDEFFRAGSFEFDTSEEFEAIPEGSLDVHVRTVTDFDSWKDLLTEAGSIWMRRRLGL